MATLPNCNRSDSPAVLQEMADGEAMSLPQAARLIPGSRGGKPTSPATIWRWIAEGVRQPGGGRVHLEAGRIGCRWFTTRAAVKRFLEAQNQPAASQPIPGKENQAQTSERRNSAERRREIAEAEEALRRAGV